MMKFDDKKFIAEQIKLHRKKKGLTQEELAEKVDLSVQHVSRIENGCYYPSLNSFFQLINVLQIDLKVFGFDVRELENKTKNKLISIILSASESEIVLYDNLLEAAKSSLDEIKKSK